ncbi:Maltose acetyltransferase [Phytophthora pseudosyringae]|uniref:Maltose acetyltransferase n=1 Tax=Phytophthora pseudosyringae TaxID=221518 RepID=A0A8T1V5S4_9STRA|nr:Maltose acetyltransferase [Phytophthora pseudosyringae]
MASMSSSSSNEEIAVPTPAPTSAGIYTKASENVCMWTQQSSDACDSPRSCYDCLNASPGDGVECVISSAGLCTTMADYVWQQDYRRNISDAASHYFPSTNATYCESSDPVCVACEASQFIKSASGSLEPSQFCVGSGGCVCVGFCESPVYKNKVSSAYCATLSTTTTVTVMGVSVGDIVTIVILCFAIPVIAYLWWVRRLHKRRLAREEAYRNRPPVNGPLLPLVGWKKYCADQMANQTAVIGVARNEDAVTTPTAAGGQERGDATAPLSTLQVATLSIEFEDPQHPLTAVTSTGRRRSSIDNTNVVRPRSSQPIGSSNEGGSEEEQDDEIHARATPYAPLEDRTV